MLTAIQYKNDGKQTKRADISKWGKTLNFRKKQEESLDFSERMDVQLQMLTERAQMCFMER